MNVVIKYAVYERNITDIMYTIVKFISFELTRY